MHCDALRWGLPRVPAAGTSHITRLNIARRTRGECLAHRTNMRFTSRRRRNLTPGYTARPKKEFAPQERQEMRSICCDHASTSSCPLSTRRQTHQLHASARPRSNTSCHALRTNPLGSSGIIVTDVCMGTMVRHHHMGTWRPHPSWYGGRCSVPVVDGVQLKGT